MTTYRPATTRRFYLDRQLQSYRKKPASAPEQKQQPAPLKPKPKPADGDRQ